MLEGGHEVISVMMAAQFINPFPLAAPLLPFFSLTKKPAQLTESHFGGERKTGIGDNAKKNPSPEIDK